MLTIAYLNNILLHAEFSAMDYTLNIVSKCRFFLIFKHSRAPKRSWNIFHGGPGKSWIFLSVTEGNPEKIGRIEQK